MLGTFLETLTRNQHLSFVSPWFLRVICHTIAKYIMRSYFVRSIVLSKNKQVKICLPMSAKLCALNHLTLWLISLSFSNEWFSIVDIAYIGLTMALRLDLSNHVHQPCIRSSKRSVCVICIFNLYFVFVILNRDVYVICNFHWIKCQGLVAVYIFRKVQILFTLCFSCLEKLNVVVSLWTPHTAPQWNRSLKVVELVLFWFRTK